MCTRLSFSSPSEFWVRGYNYCTWTKSLLVLEFSNPFVLSMCTIEMTWNFKSSCSCALWSWDLKFQVLWHLKFQVSLVYTLNRGVWNFKSSCSYALIMGFEISSPLAFEISSSFSLHSQSWCLKFQVLLFLCTLDHGVWNFKSFGLLIITVENTLPCHLLLALICCEPKEEFTQEKLLELQVENFKEEDWFCKTSTCLVFGALICLILKVPF